MASKLQATVEHHRELTFVKLSGVIDEDNSLDDLTAELHDGPMVIVELARVDRINSCGVRDWVNWLGEAEARGARLVFVECSPAIVAQINLVSNFTAHGVVKSFFAPYYCPSCELEKLFLIETRDLVGREQSGAPICRCDECDGPMDFDDIEESYFAFVANPQKIVADDSFDALMAGGVPPSEERTRIPRPKPASSSLPSVPSLPRTPATAAANTVSMGGAGSRGSFSIPPSGPVRLALPTLGDLEARHAETAPVPFVPDRSNRAWLVLAGLLAIAVVVLAFVLFAHGMS